MRRNKIIALIAIFVLLLPSIAYASSGIGLSTPTTESVTIEKFPFHYSDHFRVYNTGDEEGVFTVDVKTEYEDVKGWVSLDKSIFTLKPEESTVVTFNIDAEEGYTGDYTVVFQSAILPKGSEENITGVGAVAYLALGQPFKFTINVPEGSLGERPPTPSVTPTSEIPEFAKNVTESESGIVKTWMGTPISLDMPSEAYLGDLVKITASFIGGGEPADMGLLIVSPSEKEYRIPRSTEFRFDEVGTWSVIVVIGDEVILGKTIQVEAKSLSAYTPYIALAGVFVIIIFLVALLLRRRKKV